MSSTPIDDKLLLEIRHHLESSARGRGPDSEAGNLAAELAGQMARFASICRMALPGETAGPLTAVGGRVPLPVEEREP